jgi:hypothetical protein
MKKMNVLVMSALLALSMSVLPACGGSSEGGAGSSAGSAAAEAGSSEQGEAAAAATEEQQADDAADVEKYLSIQMGSSYQDVVAIMGSEGKVSSQTSVGDSTSTIYEWDVKGFGSMNVTIQDEVVVGKAEMGLGGGDDVKVTYDQYQQVATGMSYDEVCAVFGGKGELVSQSSLLGITDDLYMWSGTDLGANCTITFQDGAVTSMSQYGLE